MNQQKIRKYNVLVTAIALIALMFSMLPAAVNAAGGLTMSTVYTGMSAKAGDAISYPLTFHNAAEGETVELSIVSAPEGWGGYFFGNNTSVSHIYVANGTLNGAVNFNVNVPWAAADGSYEIVIQAKGETLSSQLALTLHVKAEELGESALSVLRNQQAGSSSSTFSFTTTIRNNTPNEQTYNLAAQVPAGWTVVYKVDTVRVAAVPIGPRSSETVTVEITPAASVEAGQYKVPIAATSATETLKEELILDITGTYSIKVSTPSGLLSYDVYANKETTYTMTVSNTGNAPLNTVVIQTSVPEGWSIRLSKATIDTLAVGASENVEVTLTPSESALSGDYIVDIEARCGDARYTAEFRTTVKTETIWGFAGVALIAVALAGLWYVFHKFGRR